MWIFFRGVGVLLDAISEEWTKNPIKRVECLIYVLDSHIKSENACLYCLAAHLYYLMKINFSENDPILTPVGLNGSVH